MTSSLLRTAGRLSLLALLLGACAPLTVPACSTKSPPAESPGAPRISLLKIAGGFTRPTHIAHGGDKSNRLFIVEQGGRIWIIKNGGVQPTPFLDISPLLRSGSGEQGLLSIAFPPGYGQEGKKHFYIYYTADQGNGDTVLARYGLTADENIADPASGQPLLTIVQPFTNHNGGQLAFGPDGFLYIGVGDGGSGGDPLGNAQNLNTLLGKILRIDVESQPDTYTVPEDNPFFGMAGHRPEIWAMGLRNPWRFSFDREGGDLYIADVGQGMYEEVDLQPRSSKGGANYGWNIMEGLHCFGASNCSPIGLALPVSEYSHTKGNCSITGGFVYRGKEFPSFQGVYLYGDFCSGRIWGLHRTGETWESELLLDTDLFITTFGEDEAGNLYIADYDSGDIYRIIVHSAGR